MPDLMESLAAAIAPHLNAQAGRGFSNAGWGQKHDASTLSPSTLIYSHGPAGMLTYPGVDPVVWSNIMGADSILNMIPFVPSVYTNPTYMTITGVRDVTGSEQNAVCDPAPIAGLMKGCLVTSVFGRYSRQTETIDLTRIGKRIDRADPLDLRLQNSPMSVGNPFVGIDNTDMSFADLLTNETARKFWERNIAIHRQVARQAWIGNPANNSAGGGYMEMTGLQLLVNTGYVDAVGGASCPSMNSYVRNFGYGNISSGGANIVAAMTDIWHQLQDRARRADVTPVRWVIAMRSMLFYELSAVWPCSYLTFRCATQLVGSGASEVIDAQDAVRFRDEMRSGKYLWLDGEKVEVVFDDGIPEYSNTTSASVASGTFASDIYFLPMSVAGGRSVLYGEYFQYSNPSTNDALGNMVLGRIEGPFITFPNQTRNCVSWQTTFEPRLVLRTPWLAARLQNVRYAPIQHTPEPFPDQPYFVNGGYSTRTAPVTDYHNLWE